MTTLCSVTRSLPATNLIKGLQGYGDWVITQKVPVNKELDVRFASGLTRGEWPTVESPTGGFLSINYRKRLPGRSGEEPVQTHFDRPIPMTKLQLSLVGATVIAGGGSIAGDSSPVQRETSRKRGRIEGARQPLAELAAEHQRLSNLVAQQRIACGRPNG